PGISVPNGLAEDGLPTGFQVLAPAREDARVYRVAAALETLLESTWGGSILDRAPELEGAPRPGRRPRPCPTRTRPPPATPRSAARGTASSVPAAGRSAP